MSDLFGHSQPRAPFRDIRNQRPSTAEEKAILCKQLGELVRVVPEKVKNGSIQQTRAWMASQAAAMKLLRNSRTSVPELTASINQMRSWL